MYLNTEQVCVCVSFIVSNLKSPGDTAERSKLFKAFIKFAHLCLSGIYATLQIKL